MLQRLHSVLAKKSRGHVLFLGLIATTFVVSAHFSARIVDELVDESAQSTARNWADAFVAQGADQLDKVLAGEQLSHEDLDFFETIALVGNVFRYKIFGSDGTLLVVSDTLDDTGNHSLQDHRPAIAERIVRGEAFTETKDGRDNPDRPDIYAEAYMPYQKDGKVQGVIEVYVDQTEKSTIFKQKLDLIVLLTAVLALLSLAHAFYTGLVLRRKQQGDDHIYRLAHFDTLTGTANRAHFLSQLERTVASDKNGCPGVALHALDLDNFKTVNDALGHAAGDTLLQIVAQNLADILGENDILARIGGDEFVVLQHNVKTEKQATSMARKFVGRIRAIKEIDGMPISISISVGTALSPTHSDDMVELRKCADVALYHAKENGRNQAHVFSADMDEELRLRNKLRMTLRRAVEQKKIIVHYQPLHQSKDSRLCSFEALARLQDESGKFISPEIFIPVAEQMGLIPELGAFVLNEACKTALQWPEHLRISVNFSPLQFKENVFAVVKKALDDSGLAPCRLEVEVTEGLFIDDPENVERQLLMIKDLGVRVVMDDFGTGYSSLSYLWRFPFDKLKVDRSCFQSLGDTNVIEVLETISAMSKSMNLCITAEGIETTPQRDFAIKAGYDELQGFFFSKALPASELPLYMLNVSREINTGEVHSTKQHLKVVGSSEQAVSRAAKAS